MCVTSWFFMLHRAGFGEYFQQLVRLLYRDAYSRVLVNGRLSEAFPVQSGVRRVHLSPLLCAALSCASVLCVLPWQPLLPHGVCLC